METMQSIMMATEPDKWATSIDLKDAFFHIPIAPRHRKYLRFTVDGQHYQFRALPFGLGMSPYVFTRVMKSVGAFVQSQGLLLFLYLDDWLLLSNSFSEAETWIEWLLRLVVALGLLPNIPKCDLTPSQIYTFIVVYRPDLKRGLKTILVRIEELFIHVVSLEPGRSKDSKTATCKLLKSGRHHGNEARRSMTSTYILGAIEGTKSYICS